MASQENKDAAMTALRESIGKLTAAMSEFTPASNTIFAIAPNYQDRAAQKVIPDLYLQSIGQMKLYDSMRKSYVVIDAKGNLVPNIVQPNKRPFISGQMGGAIRILPTDIQLVGDLTLPSSSPWKSYFDTVARRYFYVNATADTEQYEHPFPPVLSNTHPIIIDTSTSFLPAGWLKLQNPNPLVPYYFNAGSNEISWVHPNLPPNPSTLTPSPDATLAVPWVKYIDPTTNKPFYLQNVTKEAQWNFPDEAFLPGPSAAQRASSAIQQVASSAQEQVDSSARVQRASSAVQQGVSSAQQQVASSAQQQIASSAQVQRASSAQQQRVSSAEQQTVSSAQHRHSD